jgi:hypothetical protein
MELFNKGIRRESADTAMKWAESEYKRIHGNTG